MAVRVRLRLKPRRGGESVETVALINSGFEADTPQLILPVKLAEKLNLLRLALSEGLLETYGTVAGPTRLHLVPQALYVQVVEEDVETEPVLADAVIAEAESEVLVSDYLAGILGIMIDDLRLGFWRLKARSDKLRRSYKPQYWI